MATNPQPMAASSSVAVLWLRQSSWPHVANAERSVRAAGIFLDETLTFTFGTPVYLSPARTALTAHFSRKGARQSEGLIG